MKRLQTKFHAGTMSHSKVSKSRKSQNLSSQKKSIPQANNFFRVQSTRLANPFEPLNSSLA